MGKILGICISEKRGTEKHEIQEANLVKDWGIEGDLLIWCFKAQGFSQLINGFI